MAWNVKTRSETEDTERMLETLYKLYSDKPYLNFDGVTLSWTELRSFTRGKYKDMIDYYETMRLYNNNRESKRYLAGESQYSEAYFINFIDLTLHREPLRKAMRLIDQMTVLMRRKFEHWRGVKYATFGPFV